MLKNAVDRFFDSLNFRKNIGNFEHEKQFHKTGQNINLFLEHQIKLPI